MTSKDHNPNSGHRKRLKQRFLKSSLEGFHDYEVVELLLTYAIPRRDVKPLAKGLLDHFKGINGLFDASVEDFDDLAGVGDNSAVLIAVIKEVAAAYLKEQAERNRQIRSPEDVVEFLGQCHSEETTERFLSIYLNSKNEVLGVETVYTGQLKYGSVSSRKVIETAFTYNARSMIFVHCFVQGKPLPTNIERNLSEELQRAASAVDILVHDHLMAGKDSHLSARELGWLKDA